MEVLHVAENKRQLLQTGYVMRVYAQSILVADFRLGIVLPMLINPTPQIDVQIGERMIGRYFLAAHFSVLQLFVSQIKLADLAEDPDQGEQLL